MKEKAEGIIFDMDGLLVDSERVYQKYWHELADEMGIVLGDDFVRTITGTNGQLIIDIVNRYYHTDRGEEILNECVRRAGESLSRHVPLKKGVREFLEWLGKRGTRISVASSSRKDWIERYLEIAGVRSFFDEAVSGEEVAHGKPSPDIFLLAADRLGLQPGKCIVFEDSFNGVRAGHASGAVTVMIPDLLQPSDEIRALADAVYPSFTEFLADAEDFIA